ncbi:hypothetical protein PIB30_044762 [Stylosanthes scabra]|uniref:Uncharacterized protein n=1 Tax=Stylosanthes scabra TaxID=79078 RepID=A0ABU6QHF0_9FABA|nr:hypothetical protein [Stylosanthes scabra]
MIQFANSNFNNFLITSQPLHSKDLPSQPLPNPWGSIPTLFLCANQEGREDTLLHEDDIESLNHEEVHECLENVEVENVDQEVEDKDKESKGMEIVYSASSEVTSSKLPSKLQFEWVNFSNLNFIGPQHYALLEMDDQLRALCGVLDKKEMESLELDESRFITCGKSESKAYSGHLIKLHNNRVKDGALSLRKSLGPWQSQEKLVDSQNDEWTNQVWDPRKSYKNQQFRGLVTYLGTCKLNVHDLESHKEHKVQNLGASVTGVRPHDPIVRPHSLKIPFCLLSVTTVPPHGTPCDRAVAHACTRAPA